MQRIAGGRTVSEIIRDIRIKRAAQLLLREACVSAK